MSRNLDKTVVDDSNTVTISKKVFDRMYAIMTDYVRMHDEVVDLRKIQLQYIKIDAKQQDYIERLASTTDSKPWLRPVVTITGLQTWADKRLLRFQAGAKVWRFSLTGEYQSDNTGGISLNFNLFE